MHEYQYQLITTTESINKQTVDLLIKLVSKLTPLVPNGDILVGSTGGGRGHGTHVGQWDPVGHSGSPDGEN